jgi:ABC-type multidrug transport system ATPase subunit
LAVPDAGTARVAGYDVVTEAAAVRRHIGVAAQDATLDDALTGRHNLVMVGELSGMRRVDSKRRAAELLEQFGLSDAADRVMKGYSGGMRRRLDIAASMMTRAPVLFLDEPTTGLDPASRSGVWDIIRVLVSEGVTLLLTTQYLDEADELADRIVVIDHGRVIAQGSPQQLKAATGEARLEVTLSAPNHEAIAALQAIVAGAVHISQGGRRLSAPVRTESGLATRVVRALDHAGVLVDDVEVQQPSLDDVFFALTGGAVTDDAATDHREEGVA